MSEGHTPAAAGAASELPAQLAWRGDGKQMVLVAAGPFEMGTDRRGRNEEHPRHTVVLPSYYIDRTPVTVAEFQRFCAATGHTMPRLYYPGGRPRDVGQHPITGVSWHAARAYAAWAGKRLPSEAEWEKAASWDAASGRKRAFPWGDTWDARLCNCADLAVGMPTPVGWFSPYGDSPYGVADMAGNVMEWTASMAWHYPITPGDERDDPRHYGVRVRRGGSYNSDEGLLRAAARVLTGSDGQFLCDGFRCAADPPDDL